VRINEDKVTLVFLVFLIIGSLVWAYLTPVEIAIDARGTVRANGEAIQVYSRIGGTIVRVFEREGSEVHTGDVLLQMDTRQLDSKKHSIVDRIHNAETRMQQLPGSLSDSAFSGRLDLLHRELLRLYQQLGETDLERERLTIASPADGIISVMASVRAGELLENGAAVATVIASDGNPILESWLSAAETGRVHEGQRARFELEEEEGDSTIILDGVVISLDPALKIIDSSPSYRVVVAPLQRSSALYYGMTCRIQFITQHERMLTLLFQRVVNHYHRIIGHLLGIH
jgi:multidrug efflux pump subunit AcrA (membrane-fusion protein)